MKNGRASFGDEEFVRLVYEIGSAKLKTDFLVAGYVKDHPHLFSFGDPGTKYVHDAVGYHAIGCGAALADAALNHTFKSFLPLVNLIYRLLEAKFLGEAAPGVGKNTLVTILKPTGEWGKFPIPKIHQIKQIWEAEGQSPIPESAAGLIEQFFSFA